MGGEEDRKGYRKNEREEQQMKGRNNRKKTRRLKSARQSGSATNGSGVVCKRGNEAIDKSVCEVYQVRNPEQCFGCIHFRG